MIFSSSSFFSLDVFLIKNLKRGVIVVDKVIIIFMKVVNHSQLFFLIFLYYIFLFFLFIFFWLNFTRDTLMLVFMCDFSFVRRDQARERVRVIFQGRAFRGGLCLIYAELSVVVFWTGWPASFCRRENRRKILSKNYRK